MTLPSEIQSKTCLLLALDRRGRLDPSDLINRIKSEKFEISAYVGTYGQVVKPLSRNADAIYCA